jgi:hypothetical protein
MQIIKQLGKSVLFLIMQIEEAIILGEDRIGERDIITADVIDSMSILWR